MVAFEGQEWFAKNIMFGEKRPDFGFYTLYFCLTALKVRIRGQ